MINTMSWAGCSRRRLCHGQVVHDDHYGTGSWLMKEANSWAGESLSMLFHGQGAQDECYVIGM